MDPKGFLRLFHPPPPKKQKQLLKSDEEKKATRDKYEQSSRNRSFQPGWLTEFKWLEFDDALGMKCSICKTRDMVGSYVTGCTNYKKTSLLYHEVSDSHIENVKKHNALINPESTQAASALRQLTKKTVDQLSLKFRNVHYLCKKGRPYVDFIKLCELDEVKGLDVGEQYRTNLSATQFASFIAEAERDRIRSEISKCKFVSAISDGTTDCSIQEAEIVYVRTCRSGQVQVYFSLVKNVAKGDAASICQVMVDGLENLCKDFKTKLVGTGTDGASTMLGAKSGAVQRLRQLTGRPFIIGVHCSGHKLELAFKDTLKAKINLYARLELFLINIYYFYRNSNLTRSGLKDSFKVLNMKTSLPTRVGGTRWVGHIELAIQTFLRGYRAIVQHLEQLQNRDVAVSRTEKGNKAKHFLKAATSRDMWLMFHFLLDIFDILVDISKKFQERTAVLSDILSEIRLAVKNLDKLKTRDGFHLRKALAEAPDNLTGGDRAFSSARERFIDAVNESLKKRFTDNPGILNACSVFSLSAFPVDEELDDYGDEEVDQLIDHFRPALEEAGIQPSKIGPEWTRLKVSIKNRFKDPSQASWAEINQKLDSVCPNILGLVDLVLAIPASSADAERGFSKLKNIKTDNRSTLLDTNLTDQMVIMLETPDIKNFDPLQGIKLWNAAPKISRRIKQPKQTVEPILTHSDMNVEAVSSTSTPQETVSAESTEPVATDSSQSVPFPAESKVTDSSQSVPFPAESTESVAIDSSQSVPSLAESTESVAIDSSQSVPSPAESTESVAIDTSHCQSVPFPAESTESVAIDSSQSVPFPAESTESVAIDSSQSVPFPAETSESVATDSSLKDDTRPMATDFNQSVLFPAKTSESEETDSSGGKMATSLQPNVNLHSAKSFLDKGIQTGPDVFESTLLSSPDMPESEEYESDEDYQFENTPSGIFEFDSKVEYADRLEMASIAFTELLEFEARG